MGEWKIGETNAYEVTIPGTEGSARGTFVDMGNPHVVAVIEDAFASLPVVESLDLVTKPVVAPVINPTRTWNSCGSTTSTRTPAWVKPRCASTNVAAAKPCPAAPACAPQALCCGQDRHQPLGHHRTWRYPARGRHRQRRKADRSSHAGRRYRFVVKDQAANRAAPSVTMMSTTIATIHSISTMRSMLRR